MGIREDFSNYVDGNGLNTPAPCVPTPGQSGSDNGTMFTSEYYTILKKNSQLSYQDTIDYNQKIGQCVSPTGLLNRVPLGQMASQDGPDNYYGVCNGCIELGNTHIPRMFLKAVLKYKGALNNVNPGTWTTQSFLIRQPQLLAAIVNASFPSLKNPLHWLVRLASFPLYLVAAISIAISCMSTSIDQADPRRLSWHLQNNMKKTSLMCWFASKIWMWRLKKDYPNKMNDVAALYYCPQGLDQNPYSKYWVSE